MVWSLVQQSSAQVTGGTSVSLPGGSAAGNLLICTASSGSATAIVAPTNWSIAVHINNGANESYILAYYNNPGSISSCAPTGGTGTFQLTISEFHCTNVQQVLATSDTGTQTGGAVTNITITTGGTAHQGDLAIVMGLQHITATSITWTDPAGYTEFTGLSVASSTNHQYAARDLSVSAAGAQSVKLTSTATGLASAGWTGVVATFTEPAPPNPSYGSQAVTRAAFF